MPSLPTDQMTPRSCGSEAPLIWRLVLKLLCGGQTLSWRDSGLSCSSKTHSR
jgi:hypothetical protein